MSIFNEKRIEGQTKCEVEAVVVIIGERFRNVISALFFLKLGL
jgi:hypothetical protein